MRAFRHIHIDAASRQVWVDGRSVELTAIEFDLLRILAEHRGIVLNREQLLEKAWGTNYFGEMRVVDVHVGHLRQKLGQAERWITTVRGVGYRFDDDRI
jgi:two-component system alkaline phosphatase synthesis response regulator PhoP